MTMGKRLHAVMVPLPAQGSINPLLNLAHLLYSRGFFITFVNTEWSQNCMAAAHDNNEFDFRFLIIPDGLPADHGRLSDLVEYTSALVKAGPVLEHHLLASLSDSEAEGVPIPPITCIISENFMSCCTHQVALNLGVPRVIFWTMCAASSIAQFNAFNLLLSHGHIPVKAGEERAAIKCLPGDLPPLVASDLFSFYRAAQSSEAEAEAEALFNWALSESQMQNKGDYVLVNTFEDLEGAQAVSALSIDGCPALAVGPVFLPNILEGRDLNRRGSMVVEEEGCLEWLDGQHPASVIYVSFGSIAVKSNQQLEELAVGLEESQHPFLWVLRRDIADGKPAVLPEGFTERIHAMNRGLIVKWAPQLKVLSHPSLAAFVTHSGWNSCLESMSFGIPMLGCPYFADQFLNCRFAKDVWKIGMDFDDKSDGLITREEIRNGVRSVMQNQEMRERALSLKHAAAKAIGNAGSSFLNLNKFMNDIEQIAKSKRSKRSLPQ